MNHDEHELHQLRQRRKSRIVKISIKEIAASYAGEPDTEGEYDWGRPMGSEVW